MLSTIIRIFPHGGSRFADLSSEAGPLDYGTRRQVREALRYAVNQANSGHDMRDWDDPWHISVVVVWIDAS